MAADIHLSPCALLMHTAAGIMSVRRADRGDDEGSRPAVRRHAVIFDQ